LQELSLHPEVRPPLRLIFRAAKLFWIERVGDPVDGGGLKSSIIQTKTDRILWKLVRIFDPRWLGVFDPVEPLLLACRHGLSVDNQRSRFMKDGIDSEDFHLDRPISGDVSR
jgi:hypothetical protein